MHFGKSGREVKMKTRPVVLTTLLLLSVCTIVNGKTVTNRHQKRSVPQNGGTFLGIPDPTYNVGLVDEVLKLIVESFDPSNEGILRNLLNYETIRKDLLLLRRSLDWVLDMGNFVERYITNPYVQDDYLGILDYLPSDYYESVDEGRPDLGKINGQTGKIALKEAQSRNPYYFISPDNAIGTRNFQDDVEVIYVPSKIEYFPKEEYDYLDFSGATQTAEDQPQNEVEKITYEPSAATQENAEMGSLDNSMEEVSKQETVFEDNVEMPKPEPILVVDSKGIFDVAEPEPVSKSEDEDSVDTMKPKPVQNVEDKKNNKETSTFGDIVVSRIMQQIKDERKSFLNNQKNTQSADQRKNQPTFTPKHDKTGLPYVEKEIPFNALSWYDKAKPFFGDLTQRQQPQFESIEDVLNFESKKIVRRKRLGE